MINHNFLSFIFILIYLHLFACCHPADFFGSIGSNFGLSLSIFPFQTILSLFLLLGIFSYMWPRENRRPRCQKKLLGNLTLCLIIGSYLIWIYIDRMLLYHVLILTSSKLINFPRNQKGKKKRKRNYGRRPMTVNIHHGIAIHASKRSPRTPPSSPPVPMTPT